MNTGPQQQVSVDADHFDRTMGLLMEQLERRDRAMVEAVRGAVVDGMVQGLHAAMDNDKKVEHFWRVGYEQLSGRARDDVSKSIGRRILTWLSGVLFAAAVYMAIKAGVLK